MAISEYYSAENETCLGRLKKELEELLEKNLNEISFGYCIPDCGKCCHIYQRIDGYTAKRIADALEVPLEEIVNGVNPEMLSEEYDEKLFEIKRNEDGSCIFLYGPSLCLIHDLAERPWVCQAYGNNEKVWGCEYYTIIEKAKELGYSLDVKLKKEWLKRWKKPNYNKESWLKYARKKLLTFQQNTPALRKEYQQSPEVKHI